MGFLKKFFRGVFHEGAQQAAAGVPAADGHVQPATAARLANVEDEDAARRLLAVAAEELATFSRKDS